MPTESTPAVDRDQSATALAPLRVSLVIPTLNEAANVERMVRTLEDIFRENSIAEHEIIVVDDHSPDGTGQIADRLAAELPGRVRVIHRAGKASLGTAAVQGWASARGRVLAIMDCDFQHPPTLIPRLLDAIESGADLAIASRYTEGGKIPAWSLHRRIASSLSTFATRLALGKATDRVTDPLSGCFAMRREVIEKTTLKPRGFKVLLEVLGQGRFHVVREVPYEFSARTAGESKLRVSVAFHDAMLLLRLTFQTRLRKRAD
jgi:dolichol-phosphate mannosyltransferase